MAQRGPDQRAALDRDLDRARREWERLGAVEAEIGTWSEDDVLNFVLEWSLEEERLRRPTEHASRGDLSNRQRRFDQLLRLVEHQRHVLDRIVNGPDTVAEQASG